MSPPQRGLAAKKTNPQTTDPRWASWNLGIFVCIRCSGIHRGMGTHISRVKSVDLDAWTDEQVQSVLVWGNARANKYWEAKLAPGHAPSEAKIENFIRTKYELKRWVMDGPKPDPATLDVDGDDDVPLSLVKEKQVIERKESIRKASAGQAQVPPRNLSAPEGDLLGSSEQSSSRSNAAGPAAGNVTSKSQPVAPKPTSTRDSLLGLDFLGGAAAPARPASTTGVASPGSQSRPDLKQSILSLYASAPRPQPQQSSQQQGFGGTASPPLTHQRQGSAGGGFHDALGSLTLSSPTSPQKPAAFADPFANLGSASSSSRAVAPQPANASAFGGLSGGSFFENKPAQPAAASRPDKPSNLGLGAFSSLGSAAPTPVAAAPASKLSQSSSAMGDLFDLSAPVAQGKPAPPPQPQVTSPPSASANSVFNLSAPPSKPVVPTTSTATTTTAFGSPGIPGVDVWGTNEWSSAAAPAPSAPPAPAAMPKSSGQPKSPATEFGWGIPSSSFANTPIVPGTGGGFNSAPKVTADEEFGSWASSTGASHANTAAATTGKAGGGFGGDEDLFSNVWQ
ncbi:hypothetical protein UVI_02017120 [Ustilaginoidea virens]|uniref:Arf-GAP domain-containing protein n=1 Tax=Ustilaginoidea virens TaxID=1159556 RepID=A0A1B5KZ05_USTVR|nr:hypothetical protein UVI_02017120 [Ustilaginoidea virens]